MNFIDMHIHLQDYKSSYAKDIVTKAKHLGINKLVCASIIEEDWEKVEIYANTYPDFVVPAFGLHPWYALNRSHGWEERIVEFFNSNPTAIVGETGVDGLIEAPLSEQIKVFEQHLELARVIKRPVIIHMVKAGTWLEHNWQKLPEKFMLHSYNSSVEQLYHINKIGGYVSFSSSILRNKDKAAIVSAVPENRILIETDGPYQSGKKGVESSPADLPELLKQIAILRKADQQTLADQIYLNAVEFLK